MSTSDAEASHWFQEALANKQRIAELESELAESKAEHKADADEYDRLLEVATKRAEAAEAEAARYRKALEWYADQNQYALTGPKGVIRAMTDRGCKARAALAETKAEET